MARSSSGKTITFKYSAPEAKEVKLAGDFNSWNPSKTTLKKSKNGTWTRDLNLKPGRYEYKFVVDGQWQKDPFNSLFAKNTYGTENSVIQI
ncbi:MAG: isoamylase early set domain-containing protein [Candidatus Omnitrophota bacterium]